MPVFQYASGPWKFYCLSTDAKPAQGLAPGDSIVEIDTGKVFIWSGSAWSEVLGQTLERGVIAGERNTSSLTNNYAATKHECNSNILQNVATAQNIGTGGTTPIFLMGIQVRTALTGTLTIVGFTDPTGAAKNWVLPIGTVGQVLPPGNARRLDTGCTMTLSVAADGDFVVVDWRPIG